MTKNARGSRSKIPAVRNRIVLAGLEAAKKSRPAAFFTPETARLITPGNFEDNLAWCGEVDWIVEAVAENLEIKRKLFERVEAVRKPGTLVTSNTSGSADSTDRRRTLRRFSAALGGNAFFQSAALHETGRADRGTENATGSAGYAR